MRKELSHRYRDLLTLVSASINEWDPYSLVASGSPTDEFAPEVARVAAAAPGVTSEAELASVISRVFTCSFGPDNFTPQSCADVASRLFAQLRAHGFVGSK